MSARPLRAALGLALLAGVALAFGGSRAAERVEVSVEVAAGESLASLAERLYGRAALAPLLERAGWPQHQPEGRRLALPLAREHRVARGESLARIAARSSGSARRHPVLAAFSGIDDPAALELGMRVVLPAALEIRVRPGDSLARYARWAYGAPEAAGLIAIWNGRALDEPLAIGERLEIPLPGPFAVESPRAGREPKAAREVGAGPEPLARAINGSEAGASLAILAQRLDARRRGGDVEGLLAAAEALLAREDAEPAARRLALRHAAHALVALGRRGAARALIAAERGRDPGLAPDPIMDSPLVASLW